MFESIGVDLREKIERTFRLDAGNAIHVVQSLPGIVALFTQSPAGLQKLHDALIAAERGLNRMLGRNVGAQSHGREDVQTFDVVSEPGAWRR